MTDDKMTPQNLKRSADSVKLHKRLKKLIPAIGGCAMSLLVVMYVVALMITQHGSFTISVKDYGDRSLSLTLSENDSFKQATSTLKAVEVVNMNNITYTALPTDLNDVNGSHNGENYLAYTFFVKNSGEKNCTYDYSLDITRATVDIDAAVRVRVYYEPFYYVAESDIYNNNGDYIDYAKPKTGGNGAPEIDPGGREMTNFLTNDTVMAGRTENFAVGDISKFTVVIWLEGEDPDCTDEVLGGQFKVEMNMEIINSEGE